MEQYLGPLRLPLAHTWNNIWGLLISLTDEGKGIEGTVELQGKFGFWIMIVLLAWIMCPLFALVPVPSQSYRVIHERAAHLSAPTGAGGSEGTGDS